MNKTLSLLLYFGLLNPVCASPVETLQHWFANPTKAIVDYTATHHKTYWQLDSEDELGGQVRFWPQHNACVSYSPHTLFDEHTADIAQAVAIHHCQVWIGNTRHRYSKQLNGEYRDYSTLTSGLPYYATIAYSNWKTSAKIFQFHGFSAEKRKTEAGKTSDIILSLGHKGKNDELNVLQQCLRNLGYRVTKYPSEVNELGGTTNVLAKQFGHQNRFIHIEMSKTVRSSLVSDERLMERFVLCFEP